MRRADAQQIVDEYRCAVEMADIGAAIGAAKYARVNGASASKLRPMYRRAAKRLDAVVPEYERLWLGRNRVGGCRTASRGSAGWRRSCGRPGVAQTILMRPVTEGSCNVAQVTTTSRASLGGAIRADARPLTVCFSTAIKDLRTLANH